jgi:AcrR family transcriptional regulator
MEPEQRRRRVNDPDAMRSRVLDTAAAEFQLRGYCATSIHDIARMAGVTSGALHHHFPTKKALALAVIRERVAQAMREAWLTPVTSAATAPDGVASAFDKIAASVEARGVINGCPVNNLALELSLADPDFQSAIAEVFDEWRLGIAHKLRADRPGDPVNDADADELAVFVVAAYSGAMALAKAKQDAGPLRICARQLTRMLGRSPQDSR